MEKFLRDLSGEVHNRLKEINKYGNKITFKVCFNSIRLCSVAVQRKKL